MKISYTLILLLAVLLLSANTVFAPYGMPLRSYGNDVYGMGMGDTGIGDVTRINCNQENPSLMVTVNKVTVSTAASLGYFWYKNEATSFKDDELYLPYFTLFVPVKSHRIGISLNSVSSGNLDTAKEDIISAIDSELSYDEIIRKREDLFKTSFHYAWKNPYLNMGASMSYYFGNQTNYWSLDFDDSNYTDTKYEYEKIYSGINYKLGLNRQIGSFSLGLSWEPSAELEGSYRFRYNYGSEVDTLANEENLFTVPENIGVGISYNFTRSMKFNLDGYFINWSDTETAYIKENGERDFYDSIWRIGGGISYDPVLGYGKWYTNIPFRFGASYSQLPFQMNEEELNEISLTAGSTIQLDAPGRKLDFALKYVYRGNNGHSGYRDESLQLVIGVTGFDIFKQRRKRTQERDIPKVTPGMESREDRE